MVVSLNSPKILKLQGYYSIHERPLLVTQTNHVPNLPLLIVLGR